MREEEGARMQQKKYTCFISWDLLWDTSNLLFFLSESKGLPQARFISLPTKKKTRREGEKQELVIESYT
jgi:hypothetical protein